MCLYLASTLDEWTFLSRLLGGQEIMTMQNCSFYNSVYFSFTKRFFVCAREVSCRHSTHRCSLQSSQVDRESPMGDWSVFSRGGRMLRGEHGNQQGDITLYEPEDGKNGESHEKSCTYCDLWNPGVVTQEQLGKKPSQGIYELIKYMKKRTRRMRTSRFIVDCIRDEKIQIRSFLPSFRRAM